ncbi:MAG TPA: metallopeptidase family protein [Gemmatimonadales bacterium]
MRYSDFEALVSRMAAELPQEYLNGVAEIVVSPKVIPHPVRAEIYTLGECVPLPSAGGELEDIQSRVVLYHGSFQAAGHQDPDFDWREEAWETLTHEVRHHLEWRARVPDLEALDRAAESNYARQDGESFDPLFYRDGEVAAAGVFRVEDDYFLEQVVRTRPESAWFGWHGKNYQVEVPADAALPALLVVDGLEEPPPGDLVLVLTRKAGLRDLFRPRAAYQAVVEAKEVGF